jgi:phosphoribosylanthranilate isomerase
VTLIKICGITNWRDASAAVEAGADILGFHCDENSPRVLDPLEFAGIAARLPAPIVKVGVFDRTTDFRWRTEGRSLLRQFGQIQYYQDSVWTDIIRENWPMERKIKAFHLVSDRDLRSIANFNGTVQSYLLNVHTNAPGGYSNAEAYGWELVRETRQYGKKIYLAGGLTPENVGAAIARVQPYAVDVTVGVESEPGVKDPAKMKAFVQAVRAASAKL